MKAGRPIDPHSDRQRVLKAAVAIIRQARKPLKRDALAIRIAAKITPLTGKQDIGAILSEAASRNVTIGQWRLTRPERGVYGVERADG